VSFLKFFDCHCDTLLKMYRENKGFYKNNFDYDLSLLKSDDEAHIVFAVFNDGTLYRKDILSVFEYFKRHCATLYNAKAYLSVEGIGNQPDFSVTDIELYRKHGMRMASLCWNEDNSLCGGIKNNVKGLSKLGKKVIEELVRFSVIPDVSHASDRACREIVEYSGVSVCASHSNSRKICPHKRNLTDDEIKLISSTGGVVGINFYPDFVSYKNPDAESVVAHIEHIAEIAGDDHIGIGTDFDGIDKKIRTLENCSAIYKLKDVFLAKGYNETFINKLFFENFSEIFKKYE